MVDRCSHLFWRILKKWNTLAAFFKILISLIKHPKNCSYFCKQINFITGILFHHFSTKISKTFSLSLQRSLKAPRLECPPSWRRDFSRFGALLDQRPSANIMDDRWWRSFCTELGPQVLPFFPSTGSPMLYGSGTQKLIMYMSIFNNEHVTTWLHSIPKYTWHVKQ